MSAAGLDLHATPAGLDRPLGEELLEPTRIYALDCLALVETLGVDRVHAFAHITGGGLAGNTARVVPDGLEAVLDRGTWALPSAVRLMEEHGVPREESERAFNCGVGMVAAVAGRRRRRRRRAARSGRRPGLGGRQHPAPDRATSPRPPGELLPLNLGPSVPKVRDGARRHRSARRHCGVSVGSGRRGQRGLAAQSSSASSSAQRSAYSSSSSSSVGRRAQARCRTAWIR